MQEFRRMRVLFVSGTTTVGGAARSTHELASLLASRGHAIATLLLDDSAPRRTRLHRRCMNLRVKVSDTPFANIVDSITRSIGSRVSLRSEATNYESHTAIRPENALARRIREFRPDVVVVNSVDLPVWRQIHYDLANLRLPAVLYIREESGLLHLSHSGILPDLIVANAQGHVDAADALGHAAILVPSVVDCSACQTNSTREAVLFVNPIYEQGVDIALALAKARPDIPFIFAESWTLDTDAIDALQNAIADLPNVEFRRYRPDAHDLYATVAILLAPYRYPGRSRTIAEAQCNAIPILASDRYGPREAVGPGGILCDPDGSIDRWVDALGLLWDDDEQYKTFSDLAIAHSKRIEMQPATIMTTFETALSDLLRASTDSAEDRMK